MINKIIIENTKDFFKAIRGELRFLTKKYSKKESKAKVLPNEILRKWYNLVNLIYASKRRRVSEYLAGRSIRGINLLDGAQYRTQSGDVSFPILLQLLFSAEYIFTLIRMNSKYIQQKLDDQTLPLIDSLDKNYTESNKSIRGAIYASINFKKESISTLWKIFYNEKYIDKKEKNFVMNLGRIRNNMHNNFIAKENLTFDFEDIDSGLTCNYSIKKGYPMEVPEYILAMTEKYVKIIEKIILNIPDLPKNKADIVDL